MIEKNCTVLCLDARELKKSEKSAAVCIFAVVNWFNLVYKTWVAFRSAQYSRNFGVKSIVTYHFRLVRPPGIFESTYERSSFTGQAEILLPFEKLLSQ